jgi:cytochrome c oxidase subunit 2
MPHFRAQMNCVPGMVTEFGFTPKFTTEEMRLNLEVIEKTNGINKIRMAKGEDPYEFDYLLLCNKICGASHYNMQMKITVVEQDEYDKWIAKQPTLASVIK